MLEIRDELDEFIAKMKDTEVYRDYEKQKKRLMTEPELKLRVDDYRRRSYQLQMQTPPDRLFDEMENFMRDSEPLRDIPVVTDFLNAELALCRMIQKVTSTIVEAVSEDFE